jgi:hypothetical protein
MIALNTQSVVVDANLGGIAAAGGDGVEITRMEEFAADRANSQRETACGG